MSKIGWVYGVLKQNNVDTKDMSPEEAFEELRELEKSQCAEGKKEKTDNTYSIKEQVKASLDEINKTETLTRIGADEISHDYRGIASSVKAKLDKNGGIVTRKDFGDIQVSSRLFAAGAYMKTAEEKTAVLAVPSVIENGIKIGEHINHKDRNYTTFTFAGKVIIGEKEGIVAVVVRRTSDNFYKVHRLLTPDGKSLEIEKTTE